MKDLNDFEKNLEYINERIADIKANLKECKDPNVTNFLKQNLNDFENIKYDLIFQTNNLKEQKK